MRTVSAKWLNDWICHIRVPLQGESDEFVANLGEWWINRRDRLPGSHVRLSQLDDDGLQSFANAYGTLRPLTAQRLQNGTTKSFAATATAKILYFVRPQAVTAWDKKISAHVGGRQDAVGFAEHLKVCRTWAQALETEAVERGIDPAAVGPAIGRPNSSTAKLIDEWLYQTLTRGVVP